MASTGLSSVTRACHTTGGGITYRRGSPWSKRTSTEALVSVLSSCVDPTSIATIVDACFGSHTRVATIAAIFKSAAGNIAGRMSGGS
jgi:uncharacterized protein YqjF (DUF2071 family)